MNVFKDDGWLEAAIARDHAGLGVAVALQFGDDYRLFPSNHHGEVSSWLEFELRKQFIDRGAAIPLELITVVAATAASILTGYFPAWLYYQLDDGDREVVIGCWG